MAEYPYSAKTALRVGIIQVLCGIISIAIGAFNTRKEDHKAFITFKTEGLPVWSGIMFTVTGGVGCLSYKTPRKLTIHFFLIFCVLSIITGIVMYWMLLPALLSGKNTMSWNLFFGSFLGVVAISVVVSMKGSFVSFKASLFQYNCWSAEPHRIQQRCPRAELSETTSTAFLSEDVTVSRGERQRAPGSQRHTSSARRHSSRQQHGHLSYQSSQISREIQDMQDVARPPPPPYQTIKLPRLPAYQEVTSSTEPPPYTEKVEDS